MLIRRCRCPPQPPHSFPRHSPPPSRSLHKSRRVVQYPSHARYCHLWLPKGEPRSKSARELRSFLLSWRCSTNFRWSSCSRADIEAYYRLGGTTVRSIYCPSSSRSFQCGDITRIQGGFAKGFWKRGGEVVHPVVGITISCDILCFEDFAKYVCFWT